MTHFLGVLSLIYLLYCCSISAEDSFSIEITNNGGSDAITYLEQSTVPELRFTFDPVCPNYKSLAIFHRALGIEGDNWISVKTAEYEVATGQFVIKNINFTQSGNYSATCPGTLVNYGTAQEILIKIRPQILMVELANETSSSSTFDLESNIDSYKTSYSVTANFEASSQQFLNVYVGDGYFEDGETGIFQFDVDVADALTGSNVSESHAFEVLNYPPGSAHVFELSLATIIERLPNQCLQSLTYSVYMASNKSGTSEQTEVELNLEYAPQSVGMQISNFPNGSCSISCSAQSACPSKLTETKLEIYDARQASSFSLQSTTQPAFQMPVSFCRDVNVNFGKGSQDLAFTCSITNTVGSTTVKLMLDDLTLEGAYWPEPVTTTPIDRDTNFYFLWWEILLIVLCSVFFLIILIGLGCFIFRKGSEKKPNPEPTPQLPPPLSPPQVQPGPAPVPANRPPQQPAVQYQRPRQPSFTQATGPSINQNPVYARPISRGPAVYAQQASVSSEAYV